MNTLRDSVSEAVYFSNRALSGRRTIRVQKSEISGTSEFSGCFMRIPALDHLDAADVAGVDGQSMQRVLNTLDPSEISVENDGIRLKNCNGSIKIPGVLSGNLPNCPKIPENTDGWRTVTEEQQKIMRVLGRIAQKIAPEEPLKPVHIRSDSLSVVSSGLIAIAHTSLIGKTAQRSISADLIAHLRSDSLSVYVEDPRIWFAADSDLFWSLFFEKTLTDSAIDDLRSRCAGQDRIEFAIDINQLLQAGKQAIACARAGSNTYRFSIDKSQIAIDGNHSSRLQTSIPVLNKSDANDDRQLNVHLSADHFLLAAQSMRSAMNSDESIAWLSFGSSVDPVILHDGVIGDKKGSTIEIYINPSVN